MKAYLIVFIVSIVFIVFDLLDFLDLFLIFAVFCNVFDDVLTLFQSFLQMYDWLTDTHAMLLEMLSHLKTCWEKYNADMTTIQYDDDDKQHPRRDWLINKLTVRAKNISFHHQDSRISYASPSHIVDFITKNVVRKNMIKIHPRWDCSSFHFTTYNLHRLPDVMYVLRLFRLSRVTGLILSPKTLMKKGNSVNKHPTEWFLGLMRLKYFILPLTICLDSRTSCTC